jgi:hypothetical protein
VLLLLLVVVVIWHVAQLCMLQGADCKLCQTNPQLRIPV